MRRGTINFVAIIVSIFERIKLGLIAIKKNGIWVKIKEARAGRIRLWGKWDSDKAHCNFMSRGIGDKERATVHLEKLLESHIII